MLLVSYFFPVGFCESPRQVFLGPSTIADSVTAADNASKSKTSPSETQEIHITPSVHGAITPTNAETKFDEVEVEEKALQTVNVQETLQTPDSTPAGIGMFPMFIRFFRVLNFWTFFYVTATLGVKQKVNMANPGHCGQMQAEPTVRNNQVILILAITYNKRQNILYYHFCSSPIVSCIRKIST